MAIQLIDTIKQKNNGIFPIAEANDLLGGFYQVDSIAERDSIPSSRKIEGMLCYVKNDETKVYLYQWINGEWVPPTFSARDRVFATTEERDAYPTSLLYQGFSCYIVANNSHYFYNSTNSWQEISGNAQIHIGDEPPEDTTMIWICPSEDDIEASNNSVQLDKIQEAMKSMREQINDLYYIFDRKLDSGFFPNEMEPVPDSPLPPPSGNVEHMCILRGKKINLRRLWDGELGYCKDARELYIGNDGRLDLIGKVGGIISPGPDIGGDEMGNNLTETYLDLLSPNGTKWRITPNDYGELMVYNAAVDEADDALPENAGIFKGLVINQVYGGGAANSDSTPISHGFIELYNNTENEMNLKGLSIQVGRIGPVYDVLPLKGIVKPFHSFLIRCGQHSDPSLLTTRCNIQRFDMSWDVNLSDLGMKVLLVVGKTSVAVNNPWNTDGGGTKVPGYIDMFAAGGIDELKIVDGHEGSTYGHYLSPNHSAHRKDFADSDNSAKDIEQLDFRTCDVAIYRPRSSWDGKWDIFYNKAKLDPNKPNLIFIGFGKDAHTTRTFCWQTHTTDKGELRYRKKGTEEEWTVVESVKKPIQHLTMSATVHQVIVSDLTEGTYEYYAGQEGRWSDTYQFEVKSKSELINGFTFCQTTDQQGWTEREYLDWKIAAAKIRELEAESNYYFHINTGDISQNANREFEWLYYHEGNKEDIHNMVHMATCGNNDLINKKDSTAFTYYFTHEDSPMPSVHSWDIGECHFVCLDSNNITKLSDAKLNQDMIDWFEQDMEELQGRGGARWIIVYMHLGPYSVSINKKQLPIAEYLEKWKVDVVMFGHNHTYCRTKHIKAGAGSTDATTGPYYLMSQATGYKLSGKEGGQMPWPDWYAHQEHPTDPSYVMWKVNHNTLEMKAYRLQGIHTPLEEGVAPEELDISRVQFDTYTITKPME